MKYLLILALALCVAPHYAFADGACEKYIEEAESYYHHEFVSATDNSGTLYVLEKVGSDEWPWRFDLKRCKEGVLNEVQGWSKDGDITVNSIFWSDNLNRLLISTHEFSDEDVRGETSYVGRNPKVFQLDGGLLRVIADQETKYYLDSLHHPIVFISPESYVNQSGELKWIINIPPYGVTKNLPESDWYYSSGWDDGYKYANVAKIEKQGNEYVAVKNIHLTEKPDWWDRLLIWFLRIKPIYSSDIFDDVVFCDPTEELAVAYFDEKMQKIAYWKNSKTVYLNVLNY